MRGGRTEGPGWGQAPAAGRPASFACRVATGVVGAALVLAGALPAAGQVRLEELSFTGGLSIEGYEGNLAAVTVPFVDSTDAASAAVGEFAGLGAVSLLSGPRTSVRLFFDGGLRQFAATGFEVRDYAPREWVGSLSLAFRRAIGDGAQLSGTLGLKGRSVEDRPPIPLFLQPGYGSATGSLRLDLAPIEGVRFDLSLAGGRTNYRSGAFSPQLDLLDRETVGAEIGARWGSEWTVRFFTAARASRYPEQGTFVEGDPFRRDRTVRAGVEWELQAPVFVQFGVDGTLNRSNSSRPEYDALGVRGLVAAPLWWDVGLNLYGVFTRKSYLTDLGFARLVPGEEADNASVVYLSLMRPIAPNLDGSVRFGWTRAETDIGDSYYRRTGVSVFLHYRP